MAEGPVRELSDVDNVELEVLLLEAVSGGERAFKVEADVRKLFGGERL